MQIKFSSLFLFIAFTSQVFSQNAKKPAQHKENTFKILSPKEVRKLKDSIAKRLVPIEGKSIVYIIRPTIAGMAIPMRLDCDSFQVGWVLSKTYLYTIIDSGHHIFKALAENEYHLNVNLEPGQIYYLEEEVRGGIFYARTKLKMLNTTQGKKYLSKCKISNHNRYPFFQIPGMLKNLLQWMISRACYKKKLIL